MDAFQRRKKGLDRPCSPVGHRLPLSSARSDLCRQKRRTFPGLVRRSDRRKCNFSVIKELSMTNVFIPNRRQASKDTIPKAKTKPSKPARPRRSGVSSAARVAGRQPSRAASSPEQREANSERERLLEYARVLLEPLSSIEMLCDADENMENAILFMNRAALEAMNLNHRRLNPLLRGADVRKALGCSIHQFHRDPERIRSIFRTLAADPAREHSTELQLGGVTFTLSFTPVCNRAG